jgi:SAM-dependent methyltransferase
MTMMHSPTTPETPMIRRRRLLFGTAMLPFAKPVSATTLMTPDEAAGQTRPGEPARPLDVPYVPTPMKVVDAMLDLARVTQNDAVYDLGCGDGRIVVRAAQRFGCSGIGVDLDPQRIAEARDNARKAGVAHRARFEVGDVFEFDFSRATVVTMYLLPFINLRLKPRLLNELAPGTRIVSHDFDMGDWPPERRVDVEHSRIFLWTVPPRRS